MANGPASPKTNQHPALLENPWHRRIAEAVDNLGFADHEIIVSAQGDEPGKLNLYPGGYSAIIRDRENDAKQASGLKSIGATDNHENIFRQKRDG